MRRATRFVLVGIAAAVALAAGTSLVVLRLGRPLYYTDGQRLTRADALADRPMQVFDAPLPEVELPGPLRGRAALLADGRYVYGRARGETRTELVVFDPTAPGLDPVALAIDSDGHDLAPCVAANGDLLFASDRPGGAGGFDIWRAASLGSGRFATPVPLGETVNGPADEVDPALALDGTTLVFARRVPGERGADLFVSRLDLEQAARPLWPISPAESIARLELVIDREPVFTPDGAWLYFVRERAGRGKAVLGVPHHGDEFGAALTEPVLGQSGRFSSPIPDGFSVRLLTGGTDTVVHRAAARLLRPFWDGQLALERMLWWILGVALLVLALLLLGARWRALDVVTWCLLVSLLVHLLLWWLFHSVLLAEPELPSPGEGQRISVTMIDGAAASEEMAGGGAEAERAMRAVRPDRSAENAAAAPSSELAANAAPSASVAVADAMRATPETGSSAIARQSVEDPADAIQPLSGSDALPTSDLRSAPAAQDVARSRTEAARATAIADPLVVHAPGASTPLAVGPRSDAGPSAEARELPRAEPVGTRAATASAQLADAPVTSPARASSDTALRALAGGAQSAPLEPRGVESAPSERGASAARAELGPTETVHAPGSALAAAAAPAAAPSVPSARAAVAAAADRGAQRPRTGPALEDAVESAISRSGVGSRTAALTAAAGDLDAVGPRAVDAGATRATSHAREGALELSAAAPDSGLPGGSASAAPIASALPALPRAHAERTARPGPTRAPGLHDDLSGERAGADRGAGGARGALAELGGSRLAPLGPRVTGAAPSRPSFANRGGGGDLVTAPASSLPSAPQVASASPSPGTTRTDLAALYGNRFGPRKAQAIERFGGSAETERAVENGLAYLASIQDKRGHWGRKDHEAQKYGEVWVGKTALCALAFLGAGHTPRSNSRYSDNVARAIEALIDAQGEELAHFGDTSSYSHGIATYALAECLAITGDARLRRPLERAVAWTLQNQNSSRDRRNRGGWGYFSATRRPEDGYARTSTTVWQVMALESAKLSGLEVPDAALDDARRFLRGMFDERLGAFLYNKDQSRLSSNWPTLPASTPAAVFCLLLLGDDPDDARVQAGLRYTIDRRPKAWRDASDDAFVLRAEGHPYFWYCGSLACFLAGGDAWAQWNDALKQVFLPAQNRDGSFTPIGAYANYADDRPEHAAFTTALAVLSLEVYYRYTTPLLDRR